MDKRSSHFIFIVFFLILGIASGCENDPCENVNCENGICVEGNCVCDANYEGQKCQDIARTKFIGNYEAGDICTQASAVYDVVVAAGGEMDEIVFDNLYEQGVVTIGKVSGLNLNIVEQPLGVWTISGSGVINEETGIISLDYIINLGAGASESCLTNLARIE